MKRDLLGNGPGFLPLELEHQLSHQLDSKLTTRNKEQQKVPPILHLCYVTSLLRLSIIGST